MASSLLFQASVALVCLITYSVADQADAPKSRPNVLFIAVDDLRPEIAGPYGQKQMHTPGLNKLANWSTTFTRAYCQVALCSPSRTSLLTGLRPNSNKIWSIGPYFRTQMGARGSRDRTRSLPQWFRLNGYNVSGAGKIFHPGFSSGGPSKGEGGGDGGYPFDKDGAWSRPYFFCDEFYNGTLQSPAMQEWPGAREENAGCVQSPACVKCLTDAGSISSDPHWKPAWTAADCAPSCYPDGAVADEVVRQLGEAKHSLDDGGAPFFLTAGFKRPHLGWFAPQSFFDLYNVSSLAIAANRAPPAGAPAEAFSGNGEICGMDGVTCKNVGGYQLIPDAKHAELRRAYYAAVSFMDSQLLRVLDAVEANDLRKNTIIVFWGDHGYQLGEHGEWAKITNWELGTRVPLLLSVPGVPGGQVSDALVELLDVYPTLLDAAGLPEPVDNVTGLPQLQGRSVVPLLQAHDGRAAAAFNATYSQIERAGSMQGVTVRTERWRYTEWVQFDYDNGFPIFTENNTKVELYDHQGDVESDFDAFENTNVVSNPEHAQVVEFLAADLRWYHRPAAGEAHESVFV